MIYKLPNYNFEDVPFTPKLLNDKEFDEWLKGGLKEVE